VAALKLEAVGLSDTITVAFHDSRVVAALKRMRRRFVEHKTTTFHDSRVVAALKPPEPLE